MNTAITNLQSARFFLGAPQTDKMQVYAVAQGRNAVVTQAILTNTSESESKVTLTINTIDIIRDLSVAAGETKIIDLYIVLNSNDTISLQQSVENAVNVTLNGALG